MYPARRPLFFTGGPHSRVSESKPGFTTFRKEGGPGTKKQKHSHSQGLNVVQDLFMLLRAEHTIKSLIGCSALRLFTCIQTKNEKLLE